MRIAWMTLSLIVVVQLPLPGLEPSSDTPRPLPLTRPEMKQLIEDVKVRTPRIPLPELTEEDREKLGSRAESYESVLRYAYTPWANTRPVGRSPNGNNSGGNNPSGASPSANSGSGFGGRTREPDPAMTLDYAFKTQLFWIASRVNNCHYCLGHQESKLLAAGLSEDQIAALDGDWLDHTPAERAAFAFARKLSYQPHLLNDADIAGLREHYTPMQILEMSLSVAENNILNRWKEGVAVPQRKDEGGYSWRTEDASKPRGTYLTPTSPQYQKLMSKVIPIQRDATSGESKHAVLAVRPPLEGSAEVLKALETIKTREPRLPVLSDSDARMALGEAAPAGALPQWMRLLANFSRDGVQRITFVRQAEESGDLTPLLKAQLSWIIARQDRAWYATAEAYSRLQALGQSNDQIFRLDGNWEAFESHDRTLFVVAQKLAMSPVTLTDRDVADAVAAAGPRDVVQAIHYTTVRCFFDRVTEAAGLPADAQN